MFPGTTFDQFLIQWLTRERIPFEFQHKKNDLGHSFRFLRINKNQDKAVIYLHGTGDDMLYPGSLLLQKFVLNGFETIAFDLEGHGIGGTTILSEQSFANFFERNPSLFSDLKCKRKFFIGHSLGGALALYSQAEGIIESNGIVAIGSPYDLESPAVKHLISEIAHSFTKRNLSLLKQFTPLELLPALGSFKRKKYPVRLEQAGDSLDYIRVVEKIFQTLKPIQLNNKTPALLITGEKDLIASPRNCEGWAKHFNSTTQEIEAGTSHFSLSFNPNIHNKILKWIKSLS